MNYVHMGYGSTYNNYILLEVRNGKVTGKRTYDHEQYQEFKEKQFQAYKETEAYKKNVAELKRVGRSPESIDSFLQSFVVNYTSEFRDDKEESSNKAIDGDKK